MGPRLVPRESKLSCLIFFQAPIAFAKFVLVEFRREAGRYFAALLSARKICNRISSSSKAANSKKINQTPSSHCSSVQERLVTYGSEALDTAEHLGLILGSQKQADALLEHFGSLTVLARASVHELLPFVSQSKRCGWLVPFAWAPSHCGTSVNRSRSIAPRQSPISAARCAFSIVNPCVSFF